MKQFALLEYDYTKGRSSKRRRASGSKRRAKKKANIRKAQLAQALKIEQEQETKTGVEGFAWICKQAKRTTKKPTTKAPPIPVATRSSLTNRIQRKVSSGTSTLLAISARAKFMYQLKACVPKTFAPPPRNPQ
jgi:hypothetical protein